MSIPRARGSARPRRRPSERRIRFSEAVPVRRDRRDLRRLFRRAARAAEHERKAEMTALLQRLSADHVPLSEVVPGPRVGDGVVVFLDGTHLVLVTHRGGAGMRWLGERHNDAPVWLVRAQPSFASCRFRLWFASVGAARPAEVLAKVGPVPR
ncbi:MAG: hypothetical protein ACRDOI_35810 [Trebonia sp.]